MRIDGVCVVVWLCLLSLAQLCGAFKLPLPLKVDCLSLGNNEEFRHRLKWRQGAEDKTTILLFENEVLNIHFDLPHPTFADILDVRYSNDGDSDNVSITIDNELMGSFKSKAHGGWGKFWNVFHSSGPIGTRRRLGTGSHELTLKVEHSDDYGIEIDYIRLDVHGANLLNLSKEPFKCVHQSQAADDRGKN